MVRTWVRALGAALLTAAVVGAGELGLAYGLGILRWEQSFDAGGENGWSAHLTWAAFIAALAVIGGAFAGVRSLRRRGVRDRAGGWLAVSFAATVGATATVPLVVHPAASAHVNAGLNPPLQAGITTAVGVLVGLFAAVAVLSARPVAASVLVTSIWIWMLGLVSAYFQISPGTLPSGVRLGVLDIPDAARFGENLTIYVMVTVAVLTGAAIAGYARWLGEHRVAVACAGLAGPALMAAAYLVAGRGISGDHTDQLTPYLASLLATGTGFGASVLVAVVQRREPRTAETVESDLVESDRRETDRRETDQRETDRRETERRETERRESGRRESERADERDKWGDWGDPLPARPAPPIATAKPAPAPVAPPEPVTRSGRRAPKPPKPARQPKVPKQPKATPEEEYATWLSQLTNTAGDDETLGKPRG